MSQYADDTTLILANDFSITRAFNIIKIFEHVTGSRLNSQKTEGLWIGSAVGRPSGPVDITWVTDKLKILGVFFGLTDLTHANWTNRVIKLEKRLNLWKSRTLSLKGKSMIINTLGASGLWYTATVLPMPGSVRTRVNKAIFDFLWNGKTEQVKRDTCHLPLALGGLAVVDPADKAHALKLRWVPCIGDPTCEAKWIYFARYWIGLALSRKATSWSFLRSNDCPKYVGDSPLMYFRHLLTAVDRIKSDLTSLPDYRVKTLYAKLAYSRPTRLPCTAAWDRKFQTRFPWSEIWPRIYGGLSTNWEADIAWRIAHGIIKTRAYLHRWQRLRVSDRCAVCGRVESLSHAFCECSFVPTVWVWVFSLVNQFYSVPIIFSQSLVLLKQGFPSGSQYTRSNALTCFMFNLTLNELWLARNQFTFEGKLSNARAVILTIKHRIRERIRAAFNFNSIQEFTKSWCNNQVLCTVEDITLRVVI